MDVRKLDLNLLYVFEVMLQECNVSAAARRLRMSQPGVSACIARLRRTFDDELFVRVGIGMAPTPLALEVAESVHRVLGTVRDEIMRPVAFDPETTTRCFVISTSDIGELVFLPRIIRRLRDTAPNAMLRCVAVPHTRLEPALEDGSVDAVLGYFPDLTGANIYCQRLFEHPFACIVRKDHPTIGERMTIEQFLTAEHLVVNQDGRSQEIFERLLQEMGLDRRVVLHLPHFMSVPQIISDTDMISTVPFTLGLHFQANGGIRCVAPPFDVPAIPLKQFWHRRSQRDPGATWLRALVRDAFINKDPYDVAANA